MSSRHPRAALCPGSTRPRRWQWRRRTRRRGRLVGHVHALRRLGGIRVLVPGEE